MKLEDIGFYTLSDERARNACVSSPLMRCELLVTDQCNFNCPYCRGSGVKGDMRFGDALAILHYWLTNGLKNLRISGGEPTLWPYLAILAKAARSDGVERVAISTNGSASPELYDTLIDAGVNDFSVSLDGGCCATGDRMAGGIPGMWDVVVENIRLISSKTYCTVGMVFTEDNVNEAREAVEFAAELGVSDIRVIPSAQYNQALESLKSLPEEMLSRFPILKYRVGNLRNGDHVRGMEKLAPKRCYLALDDMAVAGDKHYPCIIYLREGGDAIGKVGEKCREERSEWVAGHDCDTDPICRKNCLDVCVAYNTKCAEGRE